MRYTDEQLIEICEKTTANAEDNAAVVLPLAADLQDARAQIAELQRELEEARKQNRLAGLAIDNCAIDILHLTERAEAAEKALAERKLADEVCDGLLDDVQRHLAERDARVKELEIEISTAMRWASKQEARADDLESRLSELVSAAEPVERWLTWIAGGGDYPQDAWIVLYANTPVANADNLSIRQLRALAAAVAKARGGTPHEKESGLRRIVTTKANGSQPLLAHIEKFLSMSRLHDFSGLTDNELLQAQRNVADEAEEILAAFRETLAGERP